MVARSIDWDAIQAAVYGWASDASGVQFVWANQDAPQPDYPYGLLNRTLGPVQVGHDERKWDAANEKFVVSGIRRFTVSAMVSDVTNSTTPSLSDAPVSLLSDMMSSLYSPSVIEAFRLAGIAVTNAPQVLDVSIAIGAQWVRRSQMEIIFGTTSAIEQTAFDYFNKVQINSGDIIGASTAIDIANEIFGA